MVFPFFQVCSNCITSPLSEINNANFATFTQDSELHGIEIYIFDIQGSKLGDAQASTKNGQNNGSITQIRDVFCTNR